MENTKNKITLNASAKAIKVEQSHIKKIKPMKFKASQQTGLSCIPSGGPPDSAI